MNNARHTDVRAKSRTQSPYSCSSTVSIPLFRSQGFSVAPKSVLRSWRCWWREKKFMLVCFLLPVDVFFFPCSPHPRRMSFVLGMALGSLSVCCFAFPLLPAGIRVIMGPSLRRGVKGLRSACRWMANGLGWVVSMKVSHNLILKCKP